MHPALRELIRMFPLDRESIFKWWDRNIQVYQTKQILSGLESHRLGDRLPEVKKHVERNALLKTADALSECVNKHWNKNPMSQNEEFTASIFVLRTRPDEDEIAKEAKEILKVLDQRGFIPESDDQQFEDKMNKLREEWKKQVDGPGQTFKTPIMGTKCTCGSEHVGSSGHSDWCDAK